MAVFWLAVSMDKGNKMSKILQLALMWGSSVRVIDLLAYLSDLKLDCMCSWLSIGVAMAAKTPVKIVTVECLVCFSTRTWRKYKLTESKCRKSDILFKIGESVHPVDEELWGESICATCFDRINKWWDFREKAKANIDQLSTTKERQKRLHLTPQTPQPETPNEPTLIRERKKARKTLDLSSPVKTQQPSDLTVSTPRGPVALVNMTL